MTAAPNDSDESIVARVTNGDTDAYGVLMHRYEDKLLRYVVYLIHDSATAHDVVQETFIKTYKNLHGYNPKHKFSSWIYRIAHNEAMNAIKKTKHLSDTDITELPELSYEPKLAESLDKALLAENVQGCISELEPKYREVIQLIYFERMKYDEASDVLHVPTSTIGVWLSRAKSRLKQICEQKGVQR